MPVSADERTFRPAGQDSFDAYGTAFLAGPNGRYPGAQGTLSLVADVAGEPCPHGRALRCHGVGSYLEDAFYWTTAPEWPTVYPRVNLEQRDQDSVLCSVWVNVPAGAGAFTLIEWWGIDHEPTDPETGDPAPAQHTLFRLDVAGDALTFEGGETLSSGPGALPLGEWCQVQFRVSHQPGIAGGSGFLNTCAVRVARPGYAGTTVLGQDEEDPTDGWQTIDTKSHAVPPFVRVDGVRVGMLPAGAGGGGEPEAFITLDDYCAGSVDARSRTSPIDDRPCDWMDGLWVECCALTGPATQTPMERLDPSGETPWPAEGAPTSWEAVDELPAHDGDATRLTSAEGAAFDGFAHAPLTRQVETEEETVCALSAPCFGAVEAGTESDRYFWCQTDGVTNTIDQEASEAEHYCPLRPPEHAPATETEPAAYGAGVPLWWGPQMPHPTLDEDGWEEGQTWYYEEADANATELFLQAPVGHYVTSLACEVSHTTTAVLPPYGAGGAGRTWAVWWP